MTDSRNPNGIQKVSDPADPHRCQTVNIQGQCNNLAVEGGKNCICHGGNKQIASQKLASLRNYHLTRFQGRVAQLGSSPNIKNLRDEVAILRMMLEERMNTCADANDLLMQSHTLSDLIMKIEKLVTSCNKLEGSLGQVMDKSAILQFANIVINIITTHIEDEAAINKIASELMEEIGRIGSASS